MLTRRRRATVPDELLVMVVLLALPLVAGTKIFSLSFVLTCHIFGGIYLGYAYGLIHIGLLSRSYVRWTLHQLLDLSDAELDGRILSKTDYRSIVESHPEASYQQKVAFWFATILAKFDKSHKHFVVSKQYGCLYLAIAFYLDDLLMFTGAFLLTAFLTFCDPSGPLYQFQSVRLTLKRIGVFLKKNGWFLLLFPFALYPTLFMAEIGIQRYVTDLDLLLYIIMPVMSVHSWMVIITGHGILLIPVYYLGINTKAIRDNSLLYLLLFNLSGLLLIVGAWYEQAFSVVALEAFASTIQISCSRLEQRYPDPRAQTEV